jgi:hypothetical protein
MSHGEKKKNKHNKKNPQRGANSGETVPVFAEKQVAAEMSSKSGDIQESGGRESGGQTERFLILFCDGACISYRFR